MSYRFLDHATDAIVEVTAANLKEAFSVVGDAIINITLNQDKIQEKEKREFSVEGKDLRYLLLNWIEEIVFVLITEGFAIKRIEFEIKKEDNYSINATAIGEPLNFQKHGFKVEIKAPTFYEMEIRENKGVFMKFLLDL